MHSCYADVALLVYINEIAVKYGSTIAVDDGGCYNGYAGLRHFTSRIKKVNAIVYFASC